MYFENRSSAGKALAEALSEIVKQPDVVLFALPRGGVPVAAEVAKMYHLPLDVLLVRKLGAPGQEELAMGAIAMGGLCVLNHEIVDSLSLNESEINAVQAREQIELERRNRLYRGDRDMPELKGKTVIVIDDGLATGATMRAAVDALKKARAAKVIVAVPVGAADSCEALEQQGITITCLHRPEPFLAIGQWYRDFSQTSDEEVIALLERYRDRADSSTNAE